MHKQTLWHFTCNHEHYVEVFGYFSMWTSTVAVTLVIEWPKAASHVWDECFEWWVCQWARKWASNWSCCRMIGQTSTQSKKQHNRRCSATGPDFTLHIYPKSVNYDWQFFENNSWQRFNFSSMMLMNYNVLGPVMT